jgi:hypothetical protein
LTAEGTTSKRTGSISCEVEFCIFYRLSLRTLRTKDVFDSIAQSTNIWLYLLPPCYTNSYLKSDEIKKNEMAGAYGMYEGGVRS